MSRIETLKENLTYLAHINSVLARALVRMDKSYLVENYEFCNTKKNELNLLYKRKNRAYTFHDPSGAVKEESDWFSRFIPNCQVLYVFGVGLGYSFFTFRKWLEKHPKLHIVYIEPNLAVFFHILQTDLGKKILHHPRVHFYNFRGKYQLQQLIHHLSAEFSSYKAMVIPSPIYLGMYPRTCAFIQSKLPKLHNTISTLLQEGKSVKNNFFRNFTSLVPNLDGCYNGSAPNDTFKNIPCIIVGAGPSLQKNIQILKTLSNRALILAGSSAISGLTNQGLTPHLGNYFDPYRRLLERFMTNTAFEMPTLFCARTFSEVLRWIHGPRIYLKGSMATPVVNWIENSLGFFGIQNDESISVTASSTFFAQLLGCSPIIYVGTDLAYTNNQSYMKGVLKDTSSNHSMTQEETSEFIFNEELQSVDIDGNPIKTRYGWILEAEVISSYARRTPHINFINSTEGGLGFQGIANLPLKEVTDWFLKKTYPIEEMLHSSLLSLEVRKKENAKKSLSLLKEIMKSLDRCAKYYQATLKELKALLKENKTGKLASLKTEFLIHYMTKIGHEIAYQYLLKRYHQITDIFKLKNKFLNKQLSIDAPKTLSQEISLVDMISRFTEYKYHCEEFRITLTHTLKQAKEDPW